MIKKTKRDNYNNLMADMSKQFICIGDCGTPVYMSSL